ncbi:hypothetical protein D3C72_1589390 [compost metagenome]
MRIDPVQIADEIDEQGVASKIDALLHALPPEMAVDRALFQRTEAILLGCQPGGSPDIARRKGRRHQAQRGGDLFAQAIKSFALTRRQVDVLLDLYPDAVGEV